MQKIRVLAEVDIDSVFADLNTGELKAFVRKLSAMITQRRVADIGTKEVELLQKLNEECVLPYNQLERFMFLRHKRKSTELPPGELKELFQLIEEEELLRVKRMQILGELAQLTDIPLLELMKQLGLNQPPSV